MERLTRFSCNVCGAPLEPDAVRNGLVKCGHCDSIFTFTDSAIEEHKKLERAYEYIRNGRFSDAEDICTELIRASEGCEAYWVRALAKNGVIFIRDVGDKMVPTCQSISTAVFHGDPDVKKAIELAPEDIAENYRTQSERIEAIRKEWLETARKEPPYDVFICYKDSDKENGIERTSDSVYANSVYNKLQDKGLRVFYSRVSLMDKVAEHYEPYIYGALATAKVMLVYGEKAEYFSATWVKNEWSRYITRMQRENRPATSLIVGYKGVDPYRIPSALLGGRQALDLSDPAAFSVLVERIIQAVNISKRPETLERRQVRGAAVKTAPARSEPVVKRTLGGGTQAKLNVTLENKLGMVKQYLAQKMWRDAEVDLSAVLREAPENGEALICRLLAQAKCSDLSEFARLKSFDEVFDIINILNVADKASAVGLLNSLYDMHGLSDKDYAKLVEAILPYDFEGRAANIRKLFDRCIDRDYVAVLDVLARSLAPAEQNKYIAYKVVQAEGSFARGDIAAAQQQLEQALELDETFKTALELSFKIALAARTELDRLVDKLERLLQSCPDINAELRALAEHILSAADLTDYDCAALKELLKYYVGDLASAEGMILDMAEALMASGKYDWADGFADIVLEVNAHSKRGWLDKCLIAVQQPAVPDIPNSDIPVNECYGFDEYCTLATTAEKDALFANLKAQREQMIKRAQTRVDDVRDAITRRMVRAVTERHDIKTRNKDTIIVFGAAALMIVLAILSATFITIYDIYIIEAYRVAFLVLFFISLFIALISFLGFETDSTVFKIIFWGIVAVFVICTIVAYCVDNPLSYDIFLYTMPIGYIPMVIGIVLDIISGRQFLRWKKDHKNELNELVGEEAMRILNENLSRRRKELEELKNKYGTN